MGKLATIAWGVVGGALVATSLLDVPRLLAYGRTFPFSDDWIYGLVATAILVALGAASVLAAGMEAAGRRPSPWLVAPALTALLMLAWPLTVYPPAAFRPQMLWYTLGYPFSWPPLVGAALLSVGFVKLVRWIEARRAVNA